MPIESGDWQPQEGSPRVEKAALSRLLPNLGGPNESVRRLYAGTVHAMLLYGAHMVGEGCVHPATARHFAPVAKTGGQPNLPGGKLDGGGGTLRSAPNRAPVPRIQRSVHTCTRVAARGSHRDGRCRAYPKGTVTTRPHKQMVGPAGQSQLARPEDGQGCETSSCPMAGQVTGRGVVPYDPDVHRAWMLW